MHQRVQLKRSRLDTCLIIGIQFVDLLFNLVAGLGLDGSAEEVLQRPGAARVLGDEDDAAGQLQKYERFMVRNALFPLMKIKYLRVLECHGEAGMS